MEGFVKGDIVVVLFPFSNLTDAKKRPALILHASAGDDVILCQITSKNVGDKHSITLKNDDFDWGSLSKESNIRPNKIFTASKEIIAYKLGHLKEVINTVIDLLAN